MSPDDLLAASVPEQLATESDAGFDRADMVVTRGDHPGVLQIRGDDGLALVAPATDTEIVDRDGMIRLC